MFSPFGSYFTSICCTRPEIAVWALLSDNSIGPLWQSPSKSSAPHDSLRPSLRAKQEKAKEHSNSSQCSKMKMKNYVRLTSPTPQSLFLERLQSCMTATGQYRHSETHGTRDKRVIKACFFPRDGFSTKKVEWKQWERK